MLKSKKLTFILFYFYLLLLTWCILFKFETRLSFIEFFRQTCAINWIPFNQPMIVNGKIVIAEMVFNVLVFIPLGLCLPLLISKWTHRKIIIIGFLLSLLYESLQFTLGIGIADITDLLCNTLGVCCGLLLYHPIVKLLKDSIIIWINSIGLFFIGLPTIGLIFLVIIGLMV